MVFIDTVYQRVLALANKEQRGYITPLEFNLMANQAQMDIFEQYFHDINQRNDVPGNETEYSDVLDMLDEKISIFERTAVVSGSNPFTIQHRPYRLGTVIYHNGSIQVKDHVEIEKVEQNELLPILSSPLTAPTTNRPVYTRDNVNTITVYPNSIDNNMAANRQVFCNYIKKPSKVEWGYDVVAEKALYNSLKSENFELHAAEEVKLVYRILELASIIMNKPGLVGIASQKDTALTQQEKQ
jgi:hypothetical protein|tara:strand:+ start:268 stop:990 length:723 start_codon:yes stop_codon:yes gene_type:complete